MIVTEDEAREILNQLLAQHRIVFLNDGTVSMAADPYTERELEAVLIGLRKYNANRLQVDPTQFIGGIR